MLHRSTYMRGSAPQKDKCSNLVLSELIAKNMAILVQSAIRNREPLRLIGRLRTLWMVQLADDYKQAISIAGGPVRR